MWPTTEQDIKIFLLECLKLRLHELYKHPVENCQIKIQQNKNTTTSLSEEYELDKIVDIYLYNVFTIF